MALAMGIARVQDFSMRGRTLFGSERSEYLETGQEIIGAGDIACIARGAQ
jgi:hypothetical protein